MSSNEKNMIAGLGGFAVILIIVLISTYTDFFIYLAKIFSVLFILLITMKVFKIKIN